MQCAKYGPSMMARKDMEYQLYWVKDALKKVFASGKYSRLCYVAKKAYGEYRNHCVAGLLVDAPL